MGPMRGEPATRAGPNGAQTRMSDRPARHRTPRSGVRRPRVLERLVVVAAITAVLVAVGAWIAMNRRGAAAEAAGATSSVGASGGNFTETSGPPADPATATGERAATPPEQSTAPAGS